MKLFGPILLVVSLSAAPGMAQLLPSGARIEAAAVDAQGAFYVAGYVSGVEVLPATAGTLQPNPLPSNCAPTLLQCTHGFVAKIAPSGDALLWATYIGGDRVDGVSALAVASDGSVVVAGPTSSTAFQPPFHGYQTTPARIFIARLSGDGRSLLGGTYFGGTDIDTLAALRLDSAGNVYIAGSANSIPFPTTPGAYQRERNTERPDPCSPGSDEFVAKFSPSLNSLTFSTLIATPGPDVASDLTIGPDGGLYVAGTKGTERGPCASWPMATRLAPDGSSAIYSILLDNGPGAYAIAVDSTGTAFIGSDNRKWGASPPAGTVWKLDPQGRVVANQTIAGWMRQLSAASDEIAALGVASPDRLSATTGAPGPCLDTGFPLVNVPYMARLSASTLKPSYLGFFGNSGSWLIGPERILAASPYGAPQAFAIVPVGPPPAGTATCIASAATYLGAAVAPGELVAIFGNQIGPSVPLGLQLDSGGNVTTNLGGYSVWVGGLPAPLLYAGPDQINVVTPFGIATTGKIRFEIRRDVSVVAAIEKTVVQTHAALFTANSSGAGALAALNQDGSINTASNPADPGSAVALFGTGLGAMTPQPVDGSRPPLPFSTPQAQAAVTVNGAPAVIEYIGNAPTLVQGVVQINIRLPAVIPALPSADANHPIVSVSAGLDAGAGRTATIYVR